MPESTATNAVSYTTPGGTIMLDTTGEWHREFISTIAPFVRTTLATGNGAIINLPRGSDHSPLHLTASSLRTDGSSSDLPWLGLLGPAAIVMITDPDLETDHRAAVIQNRYGLTPAEASFALEIVRGDGREAAAKRRGISVSTAHTHLNRIFEKTGVTRQAELVRILLGDDFIQ